VRTLWAIIRDTMLALRRRRLFWLHLWLSIAVVVLYAGISCHAKGWSVVYGMKEMENPWLRQGTPWENTLHCWTLARIMRWWVAGGAIFLALFATAAILPETLEPGSAALLVPRARRRSLLLGGRFVGSLFYMLLHTVFVVGGLYLALGLRMGIWHHDLWLAVPLVALIFAPLQAVAMLLGVLTRSSTAALLVAILFAGSVWALQESAAPPETDSSAAIDDKEEDNNNGLGDGLTSEIVHVASAVLPPARDSLVWLERRACPRPPRSYRDLFRRLRFGHRGIGAAAAGVFAAASSPDPNAAKQDDALAFIPLLLSSFGFAIVVMALAAWLLKRRDL
jgi:ABC-type transport system involved in multi-copper enzyme maturation permease subunit